MMEDFDNARFAKNVQNIDAALDKCEDKHDFLMSASYMLTCCKKIFTECFGAEDMAVAFMHDYLDKTEKPTLKKIV
jgi:hypothetical protein